MGEEKELVKDALEKIKVAKEAGDEATLDKYAMDDRSSVSSAAQKALDYIDGLEDTEGVNVQDELEKEKEEPSQEGWIEMTIEESKEYQTQGILKGYNPHTGMGLLKS